MKKLFWLALAFVPMLSIAQISTKVSSAIISLDRRNDIADAKKYIDEATAIMAQTNGANEKPKDLAKYYFYLGNIYYRINSSSDAAIRALDENALFVSVDALKKSIEYENSLGKKSYFKDQSLDLLKSAIMDIQNAAGTAAEKNELGKAHDLFMQSYELTSMEGINLTDTVMLYNAALMKFNEKDYPRTIELMEKLVALKYRGVQHFVTEIKSGKNAALPSLERAVKLVEEKPTEYSNPRTEGDVRPDVIMMLAASYKNSGDTAQYVATVNKGRQMFPNNERLIREELQQFLNTKQYDKAVNNLKLSLEKDPTNKVFHFILGSIYHTEMGQMDNAAQAYDRALEIDPNYADVLYMRGLLFVNKANELVEKMNKLKMNETKKYDAYKAEQVEYFKQSLPYFEKAREINPKDQDILKALREVYYKTGDTKKAMEIMELLGS